MLAFIRWDVDPAIHIGDFQLRWYGLLFAAAFFSGYKIMQGLFKRENIPLPQLDSLLIYVVIGTLVGARLGHCFFYEPEYYLAHPIEIIKIWQGGLASHGAAIGILTALYIYTKKVSKRPYLWIVDKVVIVVALSGLFIRTGNLINAEIVGKVTDVPWAFIFVRHDLLPRHPAQLYEAIMYTIFFVFLLYSYRRKPAEQIDGKNTGLFLILIFTMRFFMEFLKASQVDFEDHMALNMGQLLSIPFVIAGVVIMRRATKKSYEL